MRQWQAAPVALLAVIAGSAVATDDLVDDADQLRQASYSKYWETQVPLCRGDRVVAIHLFEDNVYVTTAEGEVLAVHPGTGLLRWARRITQRTYTIFRPTHAMDAEGAGLVVFATTSGITVINRYSGDVLKTIPAMFAPGSAAAADATRLFMGSSDGHLYAVRWHDPVQPKLVKLWRAMTGGPVRSTPMLVDADHLYCASMGGAVYCCTAGTKREQWTFRTEGAIAGDLAADADGVYVASEDRSVYKLDPISGALRWRRRLPEILEEGPVVMRGTVYQYCPGSGMFAIDATYGDVLWSLPQGRQVVAQNRGQVCLTATEDRLVLVDNATGKIANGFTASYRALAAVNRRDAAIYLISPLGRLFCARPIGEKPLTPTDLAAAHATLNQGVK